MSVIVKNMEMPQTCDECLINCGHSLLYVGITDERHPDCPLIELPPHGRLIDADELVRELASEHVGGLEAIKKYTNADTWTSGLHTAWRLIDDASTVIEAEGSETE